MERERLDGDAGRFSVAGYLDDGFAQMLVCGMSYELYWDGDARHARAYIRAFEQSRESAWYRDWIQGMYHMRAVAACFDKDTDYYDEPIQVTAKREMDEEAKLRKQEQDGLAHMESLMAALNRKHVVESES